PFFFSPQQRSPWAVDCKPHSRCTGATEHFLPVILSVSSHSRNPAPPLRRKCLLWDCTTPLECGMIGKLRFPRNGGPFMPELLLPGNIISMDARAADRLTACGNGDAALLYLWLLRHGGQLDPAKARK